MTTDFRGNGYSKNRLICDCAGEPTHAITTLLSNSLLVRVKVSDTLRVGVYSAVYSYMRSIICGTLCDFNCLYSRFLYDVTAAMLEPLNKETAAMLEARPNPPGI